MVASLSALLWFPAWTKSKERWHSSVLSGEDLEEECCPRRGAEQRFLRFILSFYFFLFCLVGFLELGWNLLFYLALGWVEFGLIVFSTELICKPVEIDIYVSE